MFLLAIFKTLSGGQKMSLLKCSRGQSPLHIMTSDGNKISETNAFLVPRWGGVAIQNINEVTVS